MDERFPEPQSMICLLCRQAELVGGFTSVYFGRAEARHVIERVPARVCPGCDEAYVDEHVAEKLLQMADEIFSTGILESITEYNIRA